MKDGIEERANATLPTVQSGKPAFTVLIGQSTKCIVSWNSRAGANFNPSPQVFSMEFIQHTIIEQLWWSGAQERGSLKCILEASRSFRYKISAARVRVCLNGRSLVRSEEETGA